MTTTAAKRQPAPAAQVKPSAAARATADVLDDALPF
jgi:hypothetical protein